MKIINKEAFKEEVLKSNKVVLVDFFATWCGPCKMLGKELEQIDTEKLGFDIVKIDVDKETNLAIEYSVEVVPTMLVFKEGKILNRLEGYLKKEQLEEEIRKCMN